MGKSDNSVKDMSIEDSFKMLDKIISNMDSDKCSIEKSIELYSSGIKILNEIDKKVVKIEKDLKIINKDK